MVGGSGSLFLLLALAAVVFVMKNKRCRPCNKESSGKDEKGKSVDLKNSNSM